MTFDVDSKFDLDASVIDKYGKKAKVIDAKMKYSATTFSYKISYLIEYENQERRWNDENTLKLDETPAEEPSTNADIPANESPAAGE